MKAVIASMCAGFLVAAAPADYLWFQKVSDEAAHLFSTMGSCASLGYQIDREGAEAYGLAILEAAAREGIPVRAAERMAVGAINRERENMDFLFERAKKSDAARDRFISFVEDRCTRLSVSMRVGRYVKRPAEMQ